MTTLIVQGGTIELDENFNLVRHRLNAAFKSVEDYRNGEWNADEHKTDDNKDGIPRPFHLMTFKTPPDEDDEDSEGGRVSINLEKIIGVESTLPSDQVISNDDEEEGEEEEVEDDEEEEDEDE